MSLQDQAVMVTGGAQGIGRAIAEAFAVEGARVAICDIDGQGASSAASDLASSSGATVVGLRMDVSDSTEVRGRVAEIEASLGPLEVLVNNAGFDVIGPFVESEEKTWDRLLEVNLKGQIICCRAVIDGMMQRGRGKIVNISSDAGKVGTSGEVVYSATKGGVIAFTKALAREVARAGVNVNCVCPGPTNTALLGQVAAWNAKIVDSLSRSIPLRRLAEPRDIAPAVVFLAGAGADYITGQALSVSGGLTMS